MRHYAGHNASCWIGDKKYIDKLKTSFILCKRQCLYLNADVYADANADDDAEMPMPRFPNGRFLMISGEDKFINWLINAFSIRSKIWRRSFSSDCTFSEVGGDLLGERGAIL